MSQTIMISDNLYTRLETTLLADVYRLAVLHQRTVYDALYLALSLREQCRFVTADEKLVNAIQATYFNIIGVATRP